MKTAALVLGLALLTLGPIRAQDSPSQAAGLQSRFTEVDAFLARKKLREAGDALEKMVGGFKEDDPARIACYRRQATIAYRQRDAARARSLFLEGISLAQKLDVKGPDVADCYLGLAECLKARGDEAHAQKALEKALDAGPSPRSKQKILARLGPPQQTAEASPDLAAAPAAVKAPTHEIAESSPAPQSGRLTRREAAVELLP